MANRHYSIVCKSRKEPKYDAKKRTVTFENVDSFEVNRKSIYNHTDFYVSDQVVHHNRFEDGLLSIASGCFLFLLFLYGILDFYFPMVSVGNLVAVIGLLMTTLSFSKIRCFLNNTLIASPFGKKNMIFIYLFFIAASIVTALQSLNINLPYGNQLGVMGIIFSFWNSF